MLKTIDLIFRTVKIILFLPLFFYCSVFAHEKSTGKYYFVPNKGQFHEKVSFRCEIENGVLFVGKNELSYVFYNPEPLNKYHANLPLPENPEPVNCHSIKFHFLDALNASFVLGSNPLPTRLNYFLGNNPQKWATDVRPYNAVQIKQLYPSVDYKIYNNNGFLKYDFIVHSPEAYKQIRLKIEGANNIYIDKEGNLKIITSINEILDARPEAYQIINGRKHPVECRFELNDDILSFKINKSQVRKQYPLIIDPTLMFATYSGSYANNFGYTATFDDFGFLYSGSTTFSSSIDYPVTTGAFQTVYGGGTVDIAITKYDTTGTFMVWSSYLGGSKSELPHSLITDDNYLYVMGTTGSADFPVTNNAFDTSFAGGPSIGLNGLGVSYSNGCDIFLSKISLDGSTLAASTFIGGSGLDGLNAHDSIKYNYADEVRGEVLIDNNGDVYIASCTQSDDFPAINALQDSLWGIQDGCIVKITNDLSTILWSTYIGGEDADALYSIDFDELHNVYLAGGTTSDSFPVVNAVTDTFSGGRADGILLHLSSDGQSILNATYVGSAEYDQLYFVKVDRAFNINVYGQTEAPDSTFIKNALYAVPNSGQLIMKFAPDIDSIIWSTVFGTGSGAPDISPTAFMVDLCNKVYLSGWGGAVNNLYFLNNNAGYTFGLPVTADAIQSTTDGSDFYLMVLEDDASALVYGSFYGGNESAEHVDGGTSRFDRKGKIYQSVCAGCGGKSDFPTTPGAHSSVNNSYGGCNNAVFKIDFNLPLIVADFDYQKPLLGCVPFEVNFINLSLSQSATHYTWDFGDGTSYSNLLNPTHYYSDTGTFLVTLYAEDTLSCNLRDTAYLPITVFKRPDVKANFSYTDTMICDSMIVDFTNMSEGDDLSYYWSFGNGQTATAINPQTYYLSDGYYLVSLIAEDTVCNVPDTAYQLISYQYDLFTPGFYVTATLGCGNLNIMAVDTSVGDNLTRYWDFGTGNLFQDSVLYITLPYQDSVDLTFIVEETVCQVFDTLKTTLGFDLPLPIKADFTVEDTVICNEMIINTQNQSTGNNISFLWQTNNGLSSTDENPQFTFSDTGQYQVVLYTIDNDCGFVDSTIQPVSFPEYPYKVEASFTVEQTDYCSFKVKATNTSTGNNLASIWTIDNSTNYITTNVNLSFSDNQPHYFYLQVTDSECNLSDDTAMMVTFNGIFLQPEIQGGNYICKYDTLEIQSNYSLSDVDKIFWSTGDTVSSIKVSSPGKYWMAVQDSICLAFDTIEVFPVQEPDKYSYTFQICEGKENTLAIYNDKYDFIWPDGSVGNTFVTDTAGTFPVKWIDEYNCWNYDTLYAVDSSFYETIWIPNTFTPNDDDINEEFKPVIDQVTEYHLSIFNRWGQEIFHTDNPQKGWNGKYKSNEPAPDGVYIYKIDYKTHCSGNKYRHRTGEFLLLK